MTIRKSLTAILLCLSGLAFGQYTDYGAWLSVGAEKKLVDNLDAEVIFETRMGDYFSRAQSIFTDWSLNYKLHDNIRVSGTYRIGLRAQEEFYLPRHRFALDVVARHSFDDFKIAYRFRYQNNNNSIAATESSLQYESGFRNKISAGYKLKKRTWIELQAEIFSSRIDDLVQPTDYRVKLGVDKGITKRQDFSIGLLWQTNIDSAEPEGELMLFAGYSWRLRKFKKKKKEDSDPSLD